MFVPEVRQPVPTISVVGEDFCYPYLVHLTVKTKVGIANKQITVLDDIGNMLLQVDGGIWQFKKTRTMHDSCLSPVIMLTRKNALSLLQQWTVHRGESLDRNNLLYTVQKSNTFQLKSEFEVFLASNIEGEICDFRVVGNYISESFKVFKGDMLIAAVEEKLKLGSLNEEQYEARIYPGVDYAFIVSLLVILNEIESH